jgi:hypothetical protein
MAKPRDRKKLLEVTNTRALRSHGEPEKCIVHDEEPLELDVIEVPSSSDDGLFEDYQIELGS